MSRPARRGAALIALALVLAVSGCTASPPSSVAPRPPATGPLPGAPLRSETTQHWLRPVARLDVDDPLGPGSAIDVAPGLPGRLDVTLGLAWRGDPPVVGEDWWAAGPARIDPAGDGRRTAVGCRAPGPSEPPHECVARYRVLLPADADLGARTTVGPITVRDLRGDTAATTTSGPITLTGLAGTVHATSDRGAVRGDLAPETLFVVTGGPVDLRLAAPPLDLRIDGGAGPVTVVLPRGAAYDVETGVPTPGTPPARVQVATDPGSPYHVAARGDGGVTLLSAP